MVTYWDPCPGIISAVFLRTNWRPERSLYLCPASGGVTPGDVYDDALNDELGREKVVASGGGRDENTGAILFPSLRVERSLRCP